MCKGAVGQAQPCPRPTLCPGGLGEGPRRQAAAKELITALPVFGELPLELFLHISRIETVL